MTYETLLANAPAQDTDAFLDYLREHNEVLHEGENWLVIKNFKYGWPTAFLKGKPDFTELMEWYPDEEWGKKSSDKQTVPSRFHLHITSKQLPAISGK